jgi:predicted nucleotidyltransferase
MLRNHHKTKGIIYHGFILYNKVMNESKLSIILSRLRTGLSDILEDQLVGVYLYGSHAREEARSDSDIDVIIVMHSDFDYGKCLDQTLNLVANLSLEYDVVISRYFVSKKRFQNEMSPFLMNIRREAIQV